MNIKNIFHKINNKIKKDGTIGLIKYFGRQVAKIGKTFLYHMLYYKIFNKSFYGIHLGSGEAIFEGFCNIDASLYPCCDVVAGVEKLKLSSNSVGIIYNSHVFEHFPREKAKAVLYEWYRVLKPGGKIFICVPDLEVLFSMYLNSLPKYYLDSEREVADLACAVIYGGQTNKYDYHFYGYSFITLKALLKSVGFTNVHRFDVSTTTFYNEKTAANAAINSIPISLNIEATK